MTAYGDLAQAFSGLQREMAQDSALSLAMAAAWLDPLAYTEDPEEDYDDFGDDIDPQSLARFALKSARNCSPRLYAELVEGLRSGMDFDWVDDTFIEGIKREWPYIPLETLAEAALYGIPLRFEGVGRYMGGMEEYQPELYGFLCAYFGETHEGPVNENDETHDDYLSRDPNRLLHKNELLSDILHASLIAQDRQPYADIALLLMYLWAETGNSMLDATEEEYYEGGNEPEIFYRHSLDNVNEGYIELLIVLDATRRAMDTLQSDDEIAGAFIRNIALIREAIGQAKYLGVPGRIGEDERRELHDKIKWPKRPRQRCAAKDYHRATGADAGLLFIRDCFKERRRPWGQ